MQRQLELTVAGCPVTIRKLPVNGGYELPACLSPAEIERALRFYFERDRRAYVLSHIGLREMLSEFTGIAPGRIEYSHNRYGKPALAGSDVRFNLSHSGEFALIGVANRREIGVDLERHREKTPEFYRDWTRKEALLKGIGCGFMEEPEDDDGWHVIDLEVEEGYSAALALAKE